MFLIIVALGTACVVASSTVQPPIPDSNNITLDVNETFADFPENQYSEEFLGCPKLSIDAKFYRMLQNGTVHVPIYGTTYDSRNYHLSNGTLYVCLPSHIKGSIDEFLKGESDEVAKILTVVFLSMSCVYLGLHLLIFILVPEYKTLSGKNTASIAACLFVAYTLFLVSGRIRETPSCSRIAAAVCYFLLCSFFWMNAFAFEVWLSLSCSISKLYGFVMKTKESTRYMMYASYSLGIPAFIVVTAAVIDSGIFGHGEFAPVFSPTRCWFHNKKPFIVFFIAPFITLTILDVLFFVLSIRAVAKLKVSSGEHELSPKKRLSLCLKLAAATGLPWVVGIFVIFIDWKPLRIMFIVCTALQGMYIFLCYNCNAKTLKYLTRTFKGIQESPLTSVVKNDSTRV